MSATIPATMDIDKHPSLSTVITGDLNTTFQIVTNFTGNVERYRAQLTFS